MQCTIQSQGKHHSRMHTVSGAFFHHTSPLTDVHTTNLTNTTTQSLPDPDPTKHPLTQTQTTTTTPRCTHTRGGNFMHKTMRPKGGFCTACTQRLKTRAVLFGERTRRVWHIFASEPGLHTQQLPNVASIRLILRQLVPGWAACTQCRYPCKQH
mmetsp:Transcript_127778/g.220873  ORF Transcript_127778/g.220873 Transcript_127778/m.220873 type:complete len:154 (+) Transcript_127778:1686-2147(+)